jgi:putative membrane protein
MWGAGWGYWGWGWWFWIFWAAVVVLCLWVFATAGRAARDVPAEEQILRERYARGEIGRKEFAERLRDLRRVA